MQHSSIRVPALGASIASLLILFSCVDQSATEPDGLRAGWSVGNRGGLTGALHVPTNSGVIGSGRALLVVLHGCAQSYGDLESYGNWVDTSEDYGTVISLPGVAGGGVYFGCWDYYGSSHSRGSGDAADLLAHVDALLADPTLDIDPNQVYIAGLSSGGGMAMVMGCLAPDVFAGVGIAAGPTVGTSAFQTASVSTSLATAQATCETLAGSHADDFATQHMAAISGTNDYTVAQGYTQLNADVFAALYADAAGLPSLSSSPLVVEDLPGFNPAGVGTVYEDELGPRALRISATGMGHAWPAGSGSGPEIGFVATQGVDFARVLVEMLTAGNRRVVGGGLSGGGTGVSLPTAATTSAPPGAPPTAAMISALPEAPPTAATSSALPEAPPMAATSSAPEAPPEAAARRTAQARTPHASRGSTWSSPPSRDTSRASPAIQAGTGWPT